MIRQTIIILTLLALSLGTHKKHPPPAAAAVAPETTTVAGLPVPAGLEARVEFWTRVFSEIPSSRTLVYHRDHPEILYSTIQFDWLVALSGQLDSAAEEQIREQREAKVVAQYQRLLRRLARLEREPDGLRNLPESDPDYYRLCSLHGLLAGLPEKNRFAAAAGPGMIQVQRGQADEFQRVLRRTQDRLPALEAIFRQSGVPPALTRLVFVESMFQTDAVSPSGAVGLWQLMPETGQRYLTVSADKDERLDPVISTRAAARLLRANYRRLGNWPLAVTAYNTGVSRMESAEATLQTGNLARIIARYDDPWFGTAGRNFYAELLGILNAEEALDRAEEAASWPEPGRSLTGLPRFSPALLAD
jgi:membrane-bound lytic murein transglycosylase D